MRLTSNGMDLESIDSVRRGSFMTFALTRSRCARDLYVIHENTTVSPGLSLIVRGNDTPHLHVEIVSDTFAELEGAVLPPNLAGLLCHTAVGRQVFLGDGQNKAIDISHVNLRWMWSSVRPAILRPRLVT